MGFWSTLFGTSKVIESGLDLIDNAFYTDQEKAGQKIKLLKAYEPFKITQRFLAVMYSFVFLGLLVFLVVASFWVDIQPQLSVIESVMTSKLAQVISWILGFYFAGGAVEGVVDKLNKKK